MVSHCSVFVQTLVFLSDTPLQFIREREMLSVSPRTGLRQELEREGEDGEEIDWQRLGAAWRASQQRNSLY